MVGRVLEHWVSALWDCEEGAGFYAESFKCLPGREGGLVEFHVPVKEERVLSRKFIQYL